MHLLGGEVAAWADGVIAIDFTVDHELVVACEDGLAEEGDQADKGCELGGSGTGFLEITDKANTDAVLIVGGGADMAALKLVFPAVADFNFAIAGIAAVADDKVVGQAVDHAAASVVAVVNDGVAKRRSAMVANNVLPAAGLNGDTVHNEPELVVGKRLLRDAQALANADEVALEAIGCLNFAHGCAIAYGERAQGITAPHNMHIVATGGPEGTADSGNQ